MLDVTGLVSVFGFCFVLCLFPSPVPIFPIVGALLSPSDMVTGAFVGMVAGLFFGTVSYMMQIMLSFARR